jgi:hypothetical protein
MEAVRIRMGLRDGRRAGAGGGCCGGGGLAAEHRADCVDGFGHDFPGLIGDFIEGGLAVFPAGDGGSALAKLGINLLEAAAECRGVGPARDDGVRGAPVCPILAEGDGSAVIGSAQASLGIQGRVELLAEIGVFAPFAHLGHHAMETFWLGAGGIADLVEKACAGALAELPKGVLSRSGRAFGFGQLMLVGSRIELCLKRADATSERRQRGVPRLPRRSVGITQRPKNADQRSRAARLTCDEDGLWWPVRGLGESWVCVTIRSRLSGRCNSCKRRCYLSFGWRGVARGVIEGTSARSMAPSLN